MKLPARGSLAANVPVLLFLAVLLAGVAAAGEASGGQTSASSSAETNVGSVQRANPILPGDHPDPTIVRVGSTYWTTSTSGSWAPEFVLYRSPDMKRWTAAGAVFPETPAWASGDFWAPEMIVEGKRVVVYYAARKKGGPLCVAAATAERPEGPYTDHGPIVCQPDGSIDPAMARDERGRPFLIWKEDGNSEKRRTILWAQPLEPDLVHLTGEKTRLIENDPDSWEGGVVEAPFVLRHGGRFYLFYAGNSCCGTGCKYAEGVARADHLLGPWTKDPDNPIIRPNGLWRCPGHGTAVQTRNGQDFFLYHAYPISGTVYLGRESVLDRITWSADGWPIVNGGHGPSGGGQPTAVAFQDKFHNAQLSPEWKWPIGHRPAWRLTERGLEIQDKDEPQMLGRPLLSTRYLATAQVDAASTGSAGLAIVGQTDRMVTLALTGHQLSLAVGTGSQRRVLWQGDLSPSRFVWLQAQSQGPHAVSFRYSTDGKHWSDAGTTSDVSGLLAWDQGLRIALVGNGAPGTFACFRSFQFETSPSPAAGDTTDATHGSGFPTAPTPSATGA